VEEIHQTSEEKQIAYSYVRFSTAKQELGDSLRRQVEMAERYCEKHGLELHPVSYRDLGVPAFKRKNVERGALVAFIDAVKMGKIAKGSYLVVEQFDRLSHADIDIAVKLLLDLVHSGIMLVTLVDEKVWDKESIKDIGNLILAIVFMSRANNESAVKAQRLSQVWNQKKQQAGQAGTRIVTSECPRWLRANDDKTGFIVLDDRVESIRRVFVMRIGGYGSVAIVNRANKEKWPVPGSGDSWHTSLVGRLLHNRALLGEYQPHKLDEDGRRVPIGAPVLGYFPAVLDEQTFLRAHAAAERRGQLPGRRDLSLKNWLQGLLKCSCGQSMVRKNKQSTKQPDYARYYCSARHRGLTDCPAVDAKLVEAAVLTVVDTVTPAYFQGTSRVDELKARIAILAVDIDLAREKRDRYADAIGATKALAVALVQRLAEAEKSVAKLEREQAAARAELADLGSDFESVFENLAKAVQSVDSLDARAALREELSRIIEKIVVKPALGYIKVYLRGGETPVIQPLRPDTDTAVLFITEKPIPLPEEEAK
jgi:DNA invertase Pin-like site-specific DNA recombinase